MVPLLEAISALPMPRGPRKSSVESRQGSVERMHRWSASAWGAGDGGEGSSDDDGEDDEDDDDGDDDDNSAAAADDDGAGGCAGGSGGVVGISPPPAISPGCGHASARHHISPRREVTKSLRQSCVSYAAKRSMGRAEVITSGDSALAQLVPLDRLLAADGAAACCRGGDGDGVVLPPMPNPNLNLP